MAAARTARLVRYEPFHRQVFLSGVSRSFRQLAGMMRKKLATKFRQCYQHANQSHVATADAPSKSSLKPLYVVCKANLHMLGTKIL